MGTGLGMKLRRVSPSLYNKCLKIVRRRDLKKKIKQEQKDIIYTEKILPRIPHTCYIVIKKHIGEAVRILYSLSSFKMFYSKEYNRPTYVGGLINRTDYYDKIVIVTNKSLSHLVELYNDDIDEVIELDNDKLERVERYCRYTNRSNKDIISPFDFDSRNRYHCYLNDADIINDMGWVMGLPRSVITIKKAHYTTKTELEAKGIMRRYDIGQDSIFIIPAAQSVPNIPNDVWNDIIGYYKKQGRKVFYNSINGEDFGFEDAIALKNIPLDVIVYICEHIALTLSIQCGLGDVLLWSGRNIPLCMILYEGSSEDSLFIYSRLYKESWFKEGRKIEMGDKQRKLLINWGEEKDAAKACKW